MITVKRYNPDAAMSISREHAWMRETPEGGHVECGDYASLFAQFELVKAERDALAVENCIQDFIITAVKDLTRDSEGVIGWHLNGDVASWDEVLPELSHSETPATDAALAAIRNEATARALKHLCDCQLISSTVAKLKADELREAK